MAYFGMIVIFAQKYQKEAGVGTVVAMMLPYTAALYVVWTVFLVPGTCLAFPLACNEQLQRCTIVLTGV